MLDQIQPKVCFLTTIFPENSDYFDNIFGSLEKQTYLKFDLVIVNDGYKTITEIINNYPLLNIVELTSGRNAVENREIGINYCIEAKYDIVIFGDSDDYFSINRVKKSIELLSKHSIVVNDLSLFDNNGVFEEKYISNRLSNNSEIDYNFIKNKNIFGLSNTALNLNILERVKFEKELIAVDWFLYKGLLRKGNSAIFTNEIITYYRQHKNNTVGLKSNNGDYLLWWEK